MTCKKIENQKIPCAESILLFSNRPGLGGSIPPALQSVQGSIENPPNGQFRISIENRPKKVYPIPLVFLFAVLEFFRAYEGAELVVVVNVVCSF